MNRLSLVSRDSSAHVWAVLLAVLLVAMEGFVVIPAPEPLSLAPPTPVQGGQSQPPPTTSDLAAISLRNAYATLISPRSVSAPALRTSNSTSGNLTWLNATKLSPNGPPARGEYSMAYDSVSRQVVLFGGRIYGIGTNPKVFGDTWV